MLRNKTYAIINIAGLSLGLACTMLIILYVKDEVSYDRFHNNVNNIYRVVSQNFDKDGNKVRKDGNSGYLQGPRFTANIPAIKSFVRVQSGHEDIKTGTDIKSQEVLKVDSNFFSVFSFPLITGDARTCLSEPNSIVITEDEAKKHFGTTDAFGKTVMLKEEGKFVPYKVTAVAKRSPQNSSIKFNYLLPINVPANTEQDAESWFNFFLNTFVVLEKGADIATVEKQMQRFFNTDSKTALKTLTERFGPMGWSNLYLLQPFLDMHMSTELPPQNGLSDASNPMYSYILSGIALFILLIACINFVNLTVARSIKRAKEIGIRKVIGGARSQLIFQFLGESFLLCLFAFLLAIGIVQLILPVFNTLANKALALSYLFDAKLITGYVVLFFITGLLAGFYPALVLSGYSPVDTLYSRFNLAGKNYLQKCLVVFQFALASFLIIATFTIYAQFNFLTNKPLGYDDSNLLIINKNNLTRSEAGLLKNELLKNKNIVGVAPKNGGWWGTIAKIDNDSTIEFAYETIDETYLPLFKIPLVSGRNFSADFPSDSTHSILINEAFAKKAGWRNPIGKQVNFWYNKNEKYTVVGVVKDYHFEALNREIEPQLFTMKPGNQYGTAFIKIRPNTEASCIKYIEKTFKSMFPFNPFNYTFKDEENLKNYEAEAKWKQIMLFGAILTIFISSIGLFGLSVLSAEKRTKEIGIRKVLGATVKRIVANLSTEFLKLVLIALVISIPIAWIASNKWLQNYPYRITPTWQMFVGAGSLVIFIAIVTVSFQAVKAAISSPVKSLRTE